MPDDVLDVLAAGLDHLAVEPLAPSLELLARPNLDGEQRGEDGVAGDVGDRVGDALVVLLGRKVHLAGRRPDTLARGSLEVLVALAGIPWRSGLDESLLFHAGASGGGNYSVSERNRPDRRRGGRPSESTVASCGT